MAYSGSQLTRLGFGGPAGLYGSFADKEEAVAPEVTVSPGRRFLLVFVSLLWAGQVSKIDKK